MVEVGDLLAHMKQANREPDVTAYNIFINYFCKYGHLDQAIDVLEMMVSYVTRIPVRVSDTIRIGYAYTHFPKKH